MSVEVECFRVKYFLSDRLHRCIQIAHKSISKQEKAATCSSWYYTVPRRSTLSLIGEESMLSSLLKSVGGILVLVMLHIPSITGVGVGINTGAIAETKSSLYLSS